MTVALTLKEHAVAGRIAEDWAKALEPVESQIAAVDRFLRKEQAAGKVTLPKLNQMYRAFERPLADVRVLIVGQDPYPTPGHSIGLAFAVQTDVRPLPRSLRNMYKELEADLGISQASHGDLTKWADQGVMLLNRVLSVRAGAPASHKQRGWEPITEQAIRVLALRDAPLVVILWGNQARSLAPLLTGIPIIESAHPSPLSASRGFFGSQPYSRANEALAAMGAKPVDWTV